MVGMNRPTAQRRRRRSSLSSSSATPRSCTRRAAARGLLRPLAARARPPSIRQARELRAALPQPLAHRSIVSYGRRPTRPALFAQCVSSRRRSSSGSGGGAPRVLHNSPARLAVDEVLPGDARELLLRGQVELVRGVLHVDAAAAPA
eukprot:scaffold1769_cov277-Prasinococcus_capsulatus_cf.AAC.3